MDKLLLFPGASERGIFTHVVELEQSHLIKTAAEYHPTIASYINGAKRIPGKTQILLTALGAGEFWGNNVNGDYFPEAALAHEGTDYGFKTFQTNAKVYKHHINKDPNASYGDVGLSVYNSRYHRVELIVLLDNAKAPDIVERIENGDYPEWSMGCRVPFDVCSNCGNRAKTRKQYCDCLKYFMGRVHPETGRICVAINLTPNFFDISQVLIGADKIAKTLRKVASSGARPALSSAFLAEKMAETKLSAIEKEIPASDPPGTQDLVDGITHVKSREAELPRPLLNQLGTRPLSNVLSTLSMLGILPKPQEFQRIVLISIGKPDIADQLDNRGMCFDPMMAGEPTPEQLASISHRNFDPSIMEMMVPHMAARSYSAPHLGQRLNSMLEKEAAELPLPSFIKLSEEDARKPVGIVPLLAVAASLYAAVARKAAPEAVGHVDKLIAAHPGLAAALGIGMVATFGAMMGEGQKGQTSVMAPGNPDTNDLGARIEEMRSKPFLKVGAAIGSAAKQLFLGVPAAYMTSGILQKHRQSNPGDQEGRVSRFVRQYPDVISGALALNAMAHLHGKGVYHKGVAAKNFAQSHLSKLKSGLGSLSKSAAASEFLSNALIWPVAFGRAGLPGRIVGGMFDQAAVEASRKLLSNRANPNKLEQHRRKE